MKMWSQKPAERPLSATQHPECADPATDWRIRRSLAWWMSAALFAATLPGGSFAAPTDNRHVSVSQVVGKSAKALLKKEGERELREGDELTEGDIVETGDRPIVRLTVFL